MAFQALSILTSLLLLINSYEEITVLSPSSLVQEVKSLQGGKIKSIIGNFGEVPYGKKITGIVFLHKQRDGSNYWCDYDETSTPPDLVDEEKKGEYTPIFLVDHSTDCKYTVKAENVRQRGGGLMLLAYDSNVLTDEFNIDDQYGEKVGIPTVIINKEAAELIKSYSTLDNNEKVILSIKFSGAKESGRLELDMFFRSDDVKALSFFKEFDSYKEKIGERLDFRPIYKYNIFLYEETSDSIDANKVKSPCIKQQHFCVSENNDLHIDNPRFILMENVRQSCIYLVLPLNDYWEYMIQFSELCADINNPSFNQNCAENAMKAAYIDSKKEKIENCMKDLIQQKSKVEDDYNLFNKKKVYKVPELMINGVKYRGTWLSKNIFTTICNGFLDDDEICTAVTPDEIESSKKFGFTFVLFICVGIFVLMIVLLFCYRRIINKYLTETLNNRIQTQAMKTISQYNAFKETGGNASEFARTSAGNKLELN